MVGERVLVVEDDELIGESLVRALRSQEYDAARVTSLEGARAALSDGPGPDLVLLDVGLPDGDGIEFCGELSTTRPALPVVMLTARSDETDIVVGLQSGAVDYVTKPFRLAELFARVATHLRFAATRAAAAGSLAPGRVEAGSVVIETAARRAFHDGVELELRPKEFDLLIRLVSSAGEVVAREDLIADVWDEHWWGSTKTLDVHINALRRKLGVQTGDGGPISTVRGVGYRWDGAT
ncbi:MAG: response regulator transcription factor [Ilumatobacteraceae bacterium]